MKYALLIYDVAEAWEGLSADDRAAVFADYEAVGRSDAVYGGAQLQPVASATTLRLGPNGDALTTDGPFADTKEFLGGYYHVEAEDLDAALGLAARIPAVRMGGAVEVRPIVER